MPYTGYDPSLEPIDAVRFLLGDTTTPFQLADIEVQFALDQSSNIYSAAAICARALAARYSREVDTRFETIWAYDSQKSEAFERLARSMDQQAKRAGGLGLPVAGGISHADVETANSDTDRVKPFFYDNIFNNPPPSNE